MEHNGSLTPDRSKVDAEHQFRKYRVIPLEAGMIMQAVPHPAVDSPVVAVRMAAGLSHGHVRLESLCGAVPRGNCKAAALASPGAGRFQRWPKA